MIEWNGDCVSLGAAIVIIIIICLFYQFAKVKHKAKCRHCGSKIVMLNCILLKDNEHLHYTHYSCH